MQLKNLNCFFSHTKLILLSCCTHTQVRTRTHFMSFKIIVIFNPKPTDSNEGDKNDLNDSMAAL